MSQEVARKTVDFIFKSPSPYLTIEFQGGEPLMNWPAVKQVVEYALQKNIAAKRSLKFCLVSNFSLLDEGKLDFLLSHDVSLCTSLDGPPQVHDQNRIQLGGHSHAGVTHWIEEIRRRGKSAGALMTTTRRSLGSSREIVDEYRRLKLQDIFLRPLHYLGFAKRSWNVIGYEDADFLDFYRRTMDYILEVNLRGEFFRESASAMLLRKILKHEDPGYVDLRSPCGATLGQVSYNFDGDIYTCDEGRMVAAEGDQMFRVGNINSDSFNDIVDHPSTKACCAASNMEGQPLCHSCAYKPFCGICPVLNYATQNTIWGRMPTNSYCYTFMHMFDYLFEKLADPRCRGIFESWVGMNNASARQTCVGQI
jgi:His-Xaa-Ser system radical SAM maturase HxsB